VSAILATVDIVLKTISYGFLIVEDKLNFEVDKLDAQEECGLSCPSSLAVSWD